MKKKKINKRGQIAKTGIVNSKALGNYLNQIGEFWYQTIVKSFDTNDFSLDFIRGLSIADGAATLTELTAYNIIKQITVLCSEKSKIILCGGGRKNKFLIKRIKKNIIDYKAELLMKLKMIDDLGIDGDFVESQAFAYLAIRAYLKLPISFPETTGVNKPCTSGLIFKN